MVFVYFVCVLYLCVSVVDCLSPSALHIWCMEYILLRWQLPRLRLRLNDIAIHAHLSTVGCHLPYGITCHQTYPGGMEGLVDLGGWLHTEMVYLSADSHLSKY